MKFDFVWFQAINQFAGKIHWLDQLVVYYAKYSPLIFGGILLWVWFSNRSHQTFRRNAVLMAVASTAIALLINQIIGHIHFRPRPFSDHTVTLLLDKSTDSSFPSDHATGSFALALSMLLFFKRRLGYSMIVMSILLGVARVYVGTHYPLDIIGGILTGLMGTLIIRSQHNKLEPFLNWIIDTWNRVEGKVLKKSM